MNGTEFVRRAKRYAHRHNLSFRFNPSTGKGSHGQLYLGSKMTIVKRSEISKSLLSAMLKHLGIRKEDF